MHEVCDANAVRGGLESKRVPLAPEALSMLGAFVGLAAEGDIPGKIGESLSHECAAG